MQALTQFLDGKKTYITAILFGVFHLGVIYGLWPADGQTIAVIDTILGMLGLSFLRMAVTKAASSV